MSIVAPEKERRNAVLALVIVSPIAGVLVGGLLGLACSYCLGFVHLFGRSSEEWMNYVAPVLGGGFTAAFVQGRLNEESLFDSELDFWHVAVAHCTSMTVFLVITARLIGFWS